MKTHKISIIYFLSILFLATSCGGDGGGDGGGDPEPQTYEELITGSWTMSSISVDNVDVTSDFTGFSIALTSNGKGSNAGSFSINNANGIIATSGNYSLNSSSGIVLGDGTSVSISLSNSNKTLTFAFINSNTIFSGGRTEGASGNYTVILNK